MGSFVDLLPKYQSYGDVQQEAARTKLAQAQAAETAQNQLAIKQQTASAALDAQLKQQQLNDNKAMNEAWSESGGDMKQFSDSYIKKGGSVKGLLGVQQGMAQVKEQINNTDLSTNKLAAERNDILRGRVEGFEKQPEADRIAGYPAWLQGLQKEGILNPQEYQHLAQAHPDYPGSPQMGAWIGQMQAHSTDFTVTIKRQEAEAKVAEAAAATKNAASTASKTEAELPGITADSTRKKLESDAMAAALKDPEQGDSLIDKALPASVDPQANAAFKAARAAALASGNINGAAQIVATAAGHMASMSTAKRNADVATDVAKESATAPIKVATAIATEKAKAEQLSGGVGQIIDPGQRNEASRALDAADKEAIDKISAAAALKNEAQTAMGGNKVAPNLEKIELLRTLVNRVNGQELKSVGASGDAFDRANGWLSSWTKGQPIPDNIQKDFIAVAEGQQRLAQAKHQTVYGTVSQRFLPANAKPLQAPDIAGAYGRASVASAPSGTIKMKLPDGRSGDIDASQKARFLSDHPGAVEVQ